jgi:ammonia channel protein AmtB
MAIEWRRLGKPSVLGIATGAVAGLAAVTPASGFVGPVGGGALGGPLDEEHESQGIDVSQHGEAGYNL